MTYTPGCGGLVPNSFEKREASMAFLGRVEELVRQVRSDAHVPSLRVNETDGLVRKLVIKIKDPETADSY